MFYSYLIGKNLMIKILLKFGIHLKWKKIKDSHDLNLKWGVLLLADVFEKFRSNRL